MGFCDKRREVLHRAVSRIDGIEIAHVISIIDHWGGEDWTDPDEVDA